MILPENAARASGVMTQSPNGVPLGTVTKTYSLSKKLPDFDPATGEIKLASPQVTRANRWALKSVVNKTLKGSRTSKCMVLRAPMVGGGLSPIEIKKGETCKRAFYHGLMACGSVWTCPICASKIAERRRSEIRQAMDNAAAKGLNVHFVTLTVPHGIGDDINELLKGLRGALKRLSQGKYGVSVQLKGALVGYIRTLEVTHGLNGWHPHYHLLVFTDAGTSIEKVKSIYAPAWQRACRLAGLPIPSDEHGCTVQDGSKAADYASKWGLEDEMTKSHIKQTRRKGATPWGLLRCILDGDDPEYPAEKATALFRLYANAFKGSRQLYWSNGLRAKLEIGQEVSDEILAQKEEDERALLIGELSVKDWQIVRRVRGEAALLDAAEGGKEALAALVEQMYSQAVKSKPKSKPKNQDLKSFSFAEPALI